MVYPTLQFSSVAQSCPTPRDPMNCSTPGLPVHHQLPEFTPAHVHRVGDAIQPSHPLLSPSPPAPNPCQHRGLFQWVSSLCEVAKVLYMFNRCDDSRCPCLVPDLREKSFYHRVTFKLWRLRVKFPWYTFDFTFPQDDLSVQGYF